MHCHASKPRPSQPRAPQQKPPQTPTTKPEPASSTWTATRSVPAAVTATQQYDYDTASRLTRNSFPNINGTPRTLNYEYWPDGSIKRKQLADGTWTGQYLYDLAGRLTTIDNANPTSATEPDLFIQQAQYNARGQTTSITYGDGTSTQYTYNDQRGLLKRALNTRSATTLLDQSYTRNAPGMITSITSPLSQMGARQMQHQQPGRLAHDH
jgi:YD repeat-containing protein